MGEDIHVIPMHDLREHRVEESCWCRPQRDPEDPEVLVHNSLDRREMYESSLH